MLTALGTHLEYKLKNLTIGQGEDVWMKLFCTADYKVKTLDIQLEGCLKHPVKHMEGLMTV